MTGELLSATEGRNAKTLAEQRERGDGRRATSTCPGGTPPARVEAQRPRPVCSQTGLMCVFVITVTVQTPRDILFVSGNPPPPPPQQVVPHEVDGGLGG